MFKYFNFSSVPGRRLSALTASSLLTMVLAGCEQEAQQAAPGGMPPAPVAVMNMKAKTVPFAIELPATLAGGKEVEIRARVAGILESRNFSEGDQIEAGQSLFTLDRQPFDVEVLQAKAELNANQAREAQAKREVVRLKPLRAKKSVSQREYDDAVSRLVIAQADTQASVAKLKQAQLNLDYTQVASPVTGIVGREQVSEGTYVQGPQLLLTQLTQVDPIRLRFGLSEREQLKMRKDAEAGLLTLPENGHWKTRIQLQDGSFYQEVGEVNFNDIRVNTHTGTSELQAILPNPDLKLRPGQFVRVVLEGASREQAHVVPQRAVLDNGTGKFVYLMVTNEQGMTIARPAPVEVGEWVRQDGDAGSENGWVIRSGLKDGDQVIVDGMARIFFPGMPVNPVESDTTVVASAH